MPIPEPIECEECGSGPVYHRLTYVTVLIDDVVRPLFTPGPIMRFLGKGVYAIERRLMPRLLDFLVYSGMATAQHEPDEQTALLAKMLWEEGRTRGITIYEFRLFDLARNLFVARLASGQAIAYEGIPLPPAGVEAAWWTDNKAVMKKKFGKLDMPVARGGSADTLREAKKIFHSVTPPVIVKPHSGSGSRHTILHVSDEAELARAFKIATQVSPTAIIEEELTGAVYRATVVDGVYVAAIRRDPPHVIGDGVHTVRQLVDAANTHPARSGPYYSKMDITPAALKELSWQDKTPDSVPGAGERVQLHQKVNWSVGGTTADVTDNVHPENRALFEDVACVLKAPIVGIDFIIEDISRSWREQERCGIIECNSMPFFDNHHLPFEGKPRNVAASIWDMIEAKI